MRTHLIPSKLSTAAIAAVAAVAAAGAVAFAFAQASGSSGGPSIAIEYRGHATATATSSLLWELVPNTPATITVPPGETRLLNARFTAETICRRRAAANGFCSVRIVAQPAGGGALIQLDPASDTDFNIDSAISNTDAMEGHGVERSRRVPAGQYRVFVQRRVTNQTITFVLDDYHFAVETHG